MIVLVLLVLILLITIFVIGFAVWGGNGLPPASNRSSFNRQRNRKVLVSSSNANPKNLQTVLPSQSKTEEKIILRQNRIRHIETSPIINQPSIQNPAVVKPNDSVVIVMPLSVVTVGATVTTDNTTFVSTMETAIVTPRRAIVIEPLTAVAIVPSDEPALFVSPSRTVAIEPPPRGAWEERGWTRQNDNGRETYEGDYSVKNRRFHGRIETRNRGRNIAAYIYNPPREIRRHAHGACFQQIGNGWFLLHWARPARTVDDAILYMERVLDESLNG